MPKFRNTLVYGGWVLRRWSRQQTYVTGLPTSQQAIRYTIAGSKELLEQMRSVRVRFMS